MNCCIDTNNTNIPIVDVHDAVIRKFGNNKVEFATGITDFNLNSDLIIYEGSIRINSAYTAINGIRNLIIVYPAVIINDRTLPRVTTNYLYFCDDPCTPAQASGTWGGTGSGATNINDTYFQGIGVVTVLFTGQPYNC